MFDAVVYPILFLALFFEVFLILTFFESESRRRRKLDTLSAFPTVSVVVPCHNEEASVGKTIDSLLALEYPTDRLSIIAVNDGSTDHTKEVLEAYRGNPRVILLDKQNGGKHTALNIGIEASDAEFVGCLDADSFVTPGALKLVMANFDDEKIGAVTSSMSVNAPRNMLEKMQEAEYLLGIAMRHTLATWNGLYVTPGPFTIYRKKALDELGHFRPAHNTEDLEIALRLQRGGWKIQNAPSASVYTNAPKTVKALVKQRVRWTTGFMRNAFDYRDLIGNPSYGVLGLLVLPLGVGFIFAGIGLFVISLMRAGDALLTFGQRASEVPLSFTFAPHAPDIFFTPVSALLILTAVVMAMTVAFIYTGAALARKKPGFGLSLVAYFILYTFIAAWWRIRAVTDVALGRRRSWR
jgi:cellulose synthase/poly-beta-1,6-N-acetylglucosamine synthase-like glycosyltransferase